MRVLITGATGFIGSALSRALASDGHEVVALRRGRGGPGPRWSVDEGWIDDDAMSGVEAVVHLAGESVGGRWTTDKKHEILSSRTAGTALVARAVAEAHVPIFVCGSAIGFYGSRGSQELTEEADRGGGFLANVVEAWEASALPAVEAGARVVFARTSLVLAKSGGSLPRMMLPFKFGVGGRIASGDQFWSWITLEDAVRAIQHCLADEALSGPVNLSAPHPVPNREFVSELAEALHRPGLLPTPAFALWAVLGRQFADEVLLASQRVVPDRLLAAGFEFRHPEVGEALRSILA